MKRKTYICAALAFSMMLVAITGCSSGGGVATSAAKGLEKLGEIHVVSREEGSGTRNVFAESIGFLDSTTGRDLTLDAAVVAGDGDTVKKLVQEDTNAIGYVSAGLVKDDDKLRTVTVDGKKLDRGFYLAYSGKLTELEQEFITYIEGTGQEIVQRSFTPIGSVKQFLSLKPKGSIKIGGSSSMYELMQELAAAYMELNPNATIEVIGTDSTNGLTGTMSGIYDIGMSSRELKVYEKELLSFEVIARDEIAVIVHADNPLENISSKDLKAIYTGEITRWKELTEE